MAWRDKSGWLNFVSCNDGWVVDEKEKQGRWRWKWCGGYKRICQIRGRSYLIALGRPRISTITHRIGTATCHLRNGVFTCTWHSLQSQFLMIISPISSHVSLSHPQLYHHLRTRCVVISLYLSMPWSKVYTEYSIHGVQHTLSTVYTEFSIQPVLHTLSTAYTAYCNLPRSTVFPLPASLSSLCRPCCTQFSIFQQLWLNQWIESHLPLRLPLELPPPCTPPISLDHGLQVHLLTHSIMACKCISKLTRSQRRSVTPKSYDYGLQVRMITVSKCISILARLRPGSASPSSLYHGAVKLWS